jgi:SdrD B-like domain/Secretion system C-terminal sorting domain
MKNLFRFAICISFIFHSVTASAQTSGTVFRDYNGNGTRQTSAPNEPLVKGIIVNAFNSSDALIASYTTTVAGTFSIPLTGSTYNGTQGSNTGSVANALAVRLEFIIPASGACGLNPNVDYSSANGSTVGSSVRFITGGTTGITYAINSPAEYSPNTNPMVYQSKYTDGDPLGGGTSGTSTWFVGFPYNSAGTSTAPTLTLNGTTIGATWGVAFSKQAGKVFTSAFVKRHAGLGVMGSGGIYLLTPTATSFNVTNFYDMDAVGNLGAYRTRADAAASPPAFGVGTSFTLNAANTIATYLGSTDVASGKPIGVGVIGTNVQRGLTAANTAINYDPAAFDQVGKVGLGDLEISDDGKFLFVINLYDRKVYRLTLNDAYNPTSVISVTSYNLPAVTVTNGVLRPFGAKFYRGKLYVGAVSTGENSGVNNVGGTTDLYAYVFELNNATASASFTGTAVITYPLNYAKGGAMTWSGPYGTKWYPWSNNTSITDGQNTDRTYPTPMLSNIEFNESGDMIMAFMDRGGHQWSEDNYQNLATSGTLMRYAIGGDILIAGSNCNGTFTLENNGAFTSANGNSYNSGAANNQGPGTSEFFKGDVYSTFHSEVPLGSLAYLPGSGEVFIGAMDPLAINTGGVKRLSLTNGTEIAGSPYQLTGSGISGFGKAIGLGDIEFFSSVPPIEIGNRVWIDTDSDGIQDANESGLSGVEIELLDGGGTIIGTVTTAANGSYYFTSAAGVNVTGITYGVNIQPNTNYTIRIKGTVTASNTITGNAGLTGSNYFTLSNITGNGQADLSDNDASKVGGVGGRYQVSITTGSYGQNNHNIDIGFSNFNTLPVQLLSFNAQPQGSQVALTWKVTEQLNISSYFVEHSINGTSFTAIQAVTANTNTDATYNAMHANPASGINYYRIRIVNADGSVKYSEVRTVIFNGKGTLSIFPNPANDKVNVQLPETWQGKTISIKIINQLGQIMIQRQFVNASQVESIDVSKLSPGIYNIRLTDSQSQTEVRKIQVH